MKVVLWVALPLVIVGIGLAVMLLVLNSGPTNQQVIDEYKPKFAAQRERLKKIVAKLPAVGSVQANQGRQDLNPRPVHNRKTDEVNTEFLMVEHLLEPEEKLKPRKFDLSADFRLRDGLLWTGPQNPLSPSVLQDSGSRMKKQMDQALSATYLGVIRTVRYNPAVIVNEKSFLGGDVDLEGFLFDLRNDEQVASIRVQARPSDLVSYVYKQGQDKIKQAEEFTYSSMWIKARAEVVQALTQTTGGTFHFDNY